MILTIRIVDAPATPSGKAFLLCDEQGEPIPNQFASIVRCSLEGQTVEVSFAIDGEKVRFE